MGSENCTQAWARCLGASHPLVGRGSLPVRPTPCKELTQDSHPPAPSHPHLPAPAPGRLIDMNEALSLPGGRSVGLGGGGDYPYLSCSPRYL